jgi:branched-chain amino acid transport system permease protein
VSDIIKETYPAFMMVFQALREGVFGLVILFLIFELDGLAARWRTVKSTGSSGPFRIKLAPQVLRG